MDCSTAEDERECASSAEASTAPREEEIVSPTQAPAETQNIDLIASAVMAAVFVKSEHYRLSQFFSPLGFPTSSIVPIPPPAKSKTLPRFKCSKTFGREYFDSSLSASNLSLSLRIVAEAARKRDAESKTEVAAFHFFIRHALEYPSVFTERLRKLEKWIGKSPFKLDCAGVAPFAVDGATIDWIPTVDATATATATEASSPTGSVDALAASSAAAADGPITGHSLDVREFWLPSHFPALLAVPWAPADAAGVPGFVAHFHLMTLEQLEPSSPLFFPPDFETPGCALPCSRFILLAGARLPVESLPPIVLFPRGNAPCNVRWKYLGSSAISESRVRVLLRFHTDLFTPLRRPVAAAQRWCAAAGVSGKFVAAAKECTNISATATTAADAEAAQCSHVAGDEDGSGSSAHQLPRIHFEIPTVDDMLAHLIGNGANPLSSYTRGLSAVQSLRETQTPAATASSSNVESSDAPVAARCPDPVTVPVSPLLSTLVGEPSAFASSSNFPFHGFFKHYLIAPTTLASEAPNRTRFDERIPRYASSETEEEYESDMPIDDDIDDAQLDVQDTIDWVLAHQVASFDVHPLTEAFPELFSHGRDDACSEATAASAASSRMTDSPSELQISQAEIASKALLWAELDSMLKNRVICALQSGATFRYVAQSFEFRVFCTDTLTCLIVFVLCALPTAVSIAF